MFVLLLGLAPCIAVAAQAVCPSRGEWSGDDGGWIEESELTAAAAESALETLHRFVKVGIKAHGELRALDAGVKSIEGYSLKQRAEAALERGDPQADIAVSDFCRWLTTRGVYVD